MDVHKVATQILQGDRVFLENISVSTFERIYHLIKSLSHETKIFWLAFFIQDQIIIQPKGNHNCLLVLREPRGRTRFYTSKDLSFIPENEIKLYGTFKGRYSFFNFCVDVFRWKCLILVIIFWISLSIFAYLFVDTKISLIIFQSLVSALSVFVSVIVLFMITSLDPQAFYRFAESDRFYKCAQSDKYICYVGVITLISAILGTGLCTYLSNLQANQWLFGRILQSSLLSLTLCNTIICFGLVIHYHFTRQYELLQLLMIRKLLEVNQSQIPVTQTGSARSDYK